MRKILPALVTAIILVAAGCSARSTPEAPPRANPTPPPGTMGSRNAYWQHQAQIHHLRIPSPSPKARAAPSLLGADISEWQGGTTLSAYNGQFLLIREGFGTSLDYQFLNNRNQARALNLPRGYYWYAYPEYDSAVAEATDFATWTDWRPGELAVLDFEEPVSNPVSWALQFVQTFEKIRGFKPMIYMSQYLLYSYDWSPLARNGNGLWEAQWDGKLVAPASGPFAFAAAKQYTDSTHYAGISGRVDGDIFYGSTAQWAAYGAAGNSPAPTPSPSPSPASSPVPLPSPTPACSYVVQPGDTLWALVDGRWASVAAANGIANPNLIYPGQTLNLCARTPTPAGTACIITVRPGDTLSGLVGSRWAEIAAENGIRNPNLIYPGQQIRVCGSSGGSVMRVGVGCVIVRPGNTLWELFDGRWPQVAAANGIRNPNLIYPGQRICG